MGIEDGAESATPLPSSEGSSDTRTAYKELETAAVPWASIYYEVQYGGRQHGSTELGAATDKLLSALEEPFESKSKLAFGLAEMVARTVGYKCQQSAGSRERDFRSANELTQEAQTRLSEAQIALKQCLAERDGADVDYRRTVDELRAKLLAASTKGKPNDDTWWRLLLAIGLAVLIAVGLVALAVVFGPKKELTTQFQVTYDLGKIIESLLLGSGGLIAGTAYALSQLRRTPPPTDAPRHE